MKAITPYDSAFQQQLIDHTILPYGYTFPDGSWPPEPVNMDEIRQALGQRRASLSLSRFSNDDFNRFSRADASAVNETDVLSIVLPILEGDDIRVNNCVARDILFTNLGHLTDGGLVAGKPDLYHGARPELLHRNIRKQLNSQIVPSSQHNLPIVPNYFLEVKGPRGSSAVASNQACYVGALGARGMRSLQAYRQSEPPPYDGKAYTITSTYYGGTLKIYTIHPIIRPPAVQVAEQAEAFSMTQVAAWCLTGNVDMFRQGVAAYRNARDWAKRQRDEAIKQANERV